MQSWEEGVAYGTNNHFTHRTYNHGIFFVTDKLPLAPNFQCLEAVALVLAGVLPKRKPVQKAFSGSTIVLPRPMMVMAPRCSNHRYYEKWSNIIVKVTGTSEMESFGSHGSW